MQSDQADRIGHSPPAGNHRPGTMRRIGSTVVIYLLPLIVITGGVLGAKHLYETGPRAKRRPPEKQATRVLVKTLTQTSENAIIHVMGTVIASKEVLLQPRVSGEIVKLNTKFVPGGRFEENEFILQIDPQDYELTVEKTRSQIAQAEYELKLEQGQQEIAQHEWNLLGTGDAASELDRELALRKPHLAKARAELTAAKAALQEAQLNLERTTIRAPFNSIVTEENVDIGAQVSPQTRLGTLVGTDEYWVRASVPVDELHWIRFPATRREEGSPAIVRQQLGNGTGNKWEGQVVRLVGDLEPQGRMARVLISVQNPLHPDVSEANGIPLLIGAYVNVVIEGRRIENVVALPRTALRDGEKVWIMNDQGRLEIRDVAVIYRNRDTILVGSGITAAERLIVSDLPAPVAGMNLTLGNDLPAGLDAKELVSHEDEDVEHAQSE